MRVCTHTCACVITYVCTYNVYTRHSCTCLRDALPQRESKTGERERKRGARAREIAREREKRESESESEREREIKREREKRDRERKGAVRPPVSHRSLSLLAVKHALTVAEKEKRRQGKVKAG